MVDTSRYGPWAIIAGGSEGMGPEFAQQLAADGFDVVLLARKVEPLEETAALVRKTGVEVRTLSVDLTDPDVVDRIRTVTDDIDVGGRLALCHHFGGFMKERGRGGIMLMGSVAGYTGAPYTLIYNAAKAFSRVFAEGLWYELRPHGVHVVEYVVGSIKTPAMARRGMRVRPGVSEPADVAREGLEHLADGPVWNSLLAGGVDTANSLSGYPRAPVIEAMAENLRNTGIYD